MTRPMYDNLDVRAALRACAVVIAFAAHPALADVDTYADVTGGAAYESNIFLTSSDPVSSASATTRLDSGISVEGDTTKVAVSVDGQYQRYDDGGLTDASSIDVQTALTKEHEYGETRIGIGYTNASSLINAFETNGKFVGDQRQEIVSGSLSRRFDVSETTSLTADVDASRVTYSNTPAGVFTEDYDFASGSAMWQCELSERAKVGFGAVGSWYSAAQGAFDNRATTYGPAVSIDYELNDRTSAFAEISYRTTNTQTQFGPFDSDSSGSDYFGHVDLKRAFDSGGVALSLRRSVQPNSNGQQDIRDEAGVMFSHDVSETLSARGGATYIRDRSQQTSSDDRDGFAGDLALDWTLSEATHLSLAYRYLWQREGGDAANAHTIMLSLTRRVAGANS